MAESFVYSVENVLNIEKLYTISYLIIQDHLPYQFYIFNI
jgi:hypothetical protein